MSLSELRVVNPLRRLSEAGQSVWLDFLRRSLITGGGLARLVAEDLVAGVTSNPTIFHRAITGTNDYDDAIAALAAQGRSPVEVYDGLALADVAMAADVFRPVYERSGGADGFVSFELDPGLAHDPGGSVRAATELVARLDRPNVMIKVPATGEGVGAVEALTAAGVNVNITLLFSRARYRQMAEAYLAGLERRLDAGQPVAGIASVASFFVSRVDTAVDARLPGDSPLRGQVAVANAKLAYRDFGERFSGRRWERLARAGARVQRLLWASTGTKNPAYPDVVYVEELIGPATVNTMPESTLDAFRHHGVVRPGALLEGTDHAARVLADVAGQGIDLDEVAGQLLADGLRAFHADLGQLLALFESKLAR